MGDIGAVHGCQTVLSFKSLQLSSFSNVLYKSNNCPNVKVINFFHPLWVNIVRFNVSKSNRNPRVKQRILKDVLVGFQITVDYKVVLV